MVGILTSPVPLSTEPQLLLPSSILSPSFFSSFFPPNILSSSLFFSVYTYRVRLGSKLQLCQLLDAWTWFLLSCHWWWLDEGPSSPNSICIFTHFAVTCSGTAADLVLMRGQYLGGCPEDNLGGTWGDCPEADTLPVLNNYRVLSPFNCLFHRA